MCRRRAEVGGQGSGQSVLCLTSAATPNLSLVNFMLPRTLTWWRTARNNYLCRAHDSLVQLVAGLRHHHDIPRWHIGRGLLQNCLVKIRIKWCILGRDRLALMAAQDRLELLLD